jgi:hypothetical protein
VFIEMIGGDLFDEVLHGAPRPTDQDIADCAQAATHQFLALLDAGLM